jgi:hypothetical protein
MKPTVHLSLNGPRRMIGDFLVGCSVQCHSNREMTVVLANKLNAANGFTAGPLFNGIEAFFSERYVTHQRGCKFRHEKNVSNWAVEDQSW